MYIQNMEVYECSDWYWCSISTASIVSVYFRRVKNSKTMACPPIRGDNSRALASGLSYVQVDKHDTTNLYHIHQCGPCISGDTSC